MSLRKWFHLFWTTLVVGLAGSFVVGLFFFVTDPNMDWVSFLMVVGSGLMFSVFSQMGFFAYLTVNYIAKGFLTRRYLWSTLQWIIIAIVFFDVIYLRYTHFEVNNSGILGYSVFPVVLLAISLIVAVWKSKMTNNTAFTPTMFFMFVVTTLELVPALRSNELNTTLFMTVPIVCCNAFQILRLHIILGTKES